MQLNSCKTLTQEYIITNIFVKIIDKIWRNSLPLNDLLLQKITILVF